MFYIQDKLTEADIIDLIKSNSQIKGQVETYADLPVTADVNDVWIVRTQTGNLLLWTLRRSGFYLWTGTVWDKLSKLQAELIKQWDDISLLNNDAWYIDASWAPVQSVNTQTGDVVLDADDIDDTSTTNKFATQSQLDNADSAIQPWDNVSELTNDAWYIDSAWAPVQSVNWQIWIVVLDKTDVGLWNVDNTSDADKPVSTAQQAALDLKLDLAWGTMTGDINMDSNNITNLWAISNGASADASAVADFSSTTQWALIPRMTSAQRNAIVAPATWLKVYDTDTLSEWIYNGTRWGSQWLIFQAYDSAGGQDTNTIAGQTINWWTQQITETIYSHTAGTSAVTINETGRYRITYSISSATNDNARRTPRASIYVNGGEIVASVSYWYTRNNTDSDVTCSTSTVVDLTATNTVEIFSQEAGNDGIALTNANESWINIELIK